MATPASPSPGDDRLVFTAEEILSDGEYAEPLIAGGVRCHGGFVDGVYRSPRTIVRRPAVEAWQAQLERQGAEVVDIPRSLMPPQYPNLEQSVSLLRAGVREPIVRTLTIVSIVEGFGAIIRDVKVPDLTRQIVEPIDGTALAHLRLGLFEAHARDEAGHRDQGGHKQMWEAARDLALENPKIPSDVLMRMMGRRGGGERKRSFPDLDEDLERMLATMVQVLVVEVFAEGAFEWGKALLGNAEVSAEPEKAAAMVGYIQSDESPHVEYLRSALSEVRHRTLRTVDGQTISGRRVVDGMLHGALRQMTRTRREEQRDQTRAHLKEAMAVAANPAALLEEFDQLETTWSPPAATGFEEADAEQAS
jgi:hypothetical protein